MSQRIADLANQIALDLKEGDSFNIISTSEKYKLNGSERKHLMKALFELLEQEGLVLFRMPRSPKNMPKCLYCVMKINRVLGIYRLRHLGYTPPIKDYNPPVIKEQTEN